MVVEVPRWSNAKMEVSIFLQSCRSFSSVWLDKMTSDSLFLNLIDQLDDLANKQENEFNIEHKTYMRRIIEKNIRLT